MFKTPGTLHKRRERVAQSTIKKPRKLFNENDSNAMVSLGMNLPRDFEPHSTVPADLIHRFREDIDWDAAKTCFATDGWVILCFPDCKELYAWNCLHASLGVFLLPLAKTVSVVDMASFCNRLQVQCQDGAVSSVVYSHPSGLLEAWSVVGPGVCSHSTFRAQQDGQSGAIVTSSTQIAGLVFFGTSAGSIMQVAVDTHQQKPTIRCIQLAVESKGWIYSTPQFSFINDGIVSLSTGPRRELLVATERELFVCEMTLGNANTSYISVQLKTIPLSIPLRIHSILQNSVHNLLILGQHAQSGHACVLFQTETRQTLAHLPIELNRSVRLVHSCQDDCALLYTPSCIYRVKNATSEEGLVEKFLFSQYSISGVYSTPQHLYVGIPRGIAVYTTPSGLAGAISSIYNVLASYKERVQVEYKSAEDISFIGGNKTPAVPGSFVSLLAQHGEDVEMPDLFGKGPLQSNPGRVGGSSLQPLPVLTVAEYSLLDQALSSTACSLAFAVDTIPCKQKLEDLLSLLSLAYPVWPRLCSATQKDLLASVQSASMLFSLDRVVSQNTRGVMSTDEKIAIFNDIMKQTVAKLPEDRQNQLFLYQSRQDLSNLQLLNAVPALYPFFLHTLHGLVCDAFPSIPTTTGALSSSGIVEKTRLVVFTMELYTEIYQTSDKLLHTLSREFPDLNTVSKDVAEDNIATVYGNTCVSPSHIIGYSLFNGYNGLYSDDYIHLINELTTCCFASIKTLLVLSCATQPVPVVSTPFDNVMDGANGVDVIFHSIMSIQQSLLSIVENVFGSLPAREVVALSCQDAHLQTALRNEVSVQGSIHMRLFALYSTYLRTRRGLGAAVTSATTQYNVYFNQLISTLNIKTLYSLAVSSRNHVLTIACLHYSHFMRAIVERKFDAAAILPVLQLHAVLLGKPFQLAVCSVYRNLFIQHVVLPVDVAEPKDVITLFTISPTPNEAFNLSFATCTSPGLYGSTLMLQLTTEAITTLQNLPFLLFTSLTQPEHPIEGPGVLSHCSASGCNGTCQGSSLDIDTESRKYFKRVEKIVEDNNINSDLFTQIKMLQSDKSVTVPDMLHLINNNHS